MSDAAKHQAELQATALSFMNRLRHWWRETHDLDGLSRDELNRMAGEFGMTGAELEALAAKGPHGADLVYQRMQALGLTREDVERAATGMMRDLEKTCAACRDKGRCIHDLEAHPDDPTWKQYCPNAETFDDIAAAKLNRK
jgi:hypothetical protein